MSPYYFYKIGDLILVARRKKLVRSKLDVLAHSLVPKHLILTKKQTEELLDKYSIELLNLPKIFIDDPVCKALGAREGDVLEIIRGSETIVDSVVSYRVVVPRRRS